MNRQIGVKNFIRVVILDPRLRITWYSACATPKLPWSVMYSQKGHYDIASISETAKPINKKFQDNIWTRKMCPAMQYCDVITNPRWRTAAILLIAKSPYLSEKSCDFDKIWYTTADIEPMTVTWPKIEFFEIQDGGGRHLENRFFDHNSSTDCPILVKFCMRKQNGMSTRARLYDKMCKFLKSEMADGRHFENR